jgi:hypothetical protein
MIERMFDSLSDVGLLSVMREAQQRERTAVAERLLAAGRFALARFAADDEEDRSQWCLDGFELVAAELGAELKVSRGRASSEMHRGIELIERFPKLAAVFAAGEVDYRIVIVVIFRAGLIVDPDVVAILDEELTKLAPSWNGFSREKISQLVDWWVRRLDPAAERIAHRDSASRSLDVYARDDGLADVQGLVNATDGAALDAKLKQLADSVCANDPRTKAQRRADAIGALAAGATQLACGCGGADCTQDGSTSGSGVQVIVNVVAEAEALSGKSDSPALVPGFGTIPAPLARELAKRGKVRHLLAPKDFKAEPRYRPSAALAAYVRCRDLHCRFPGCSRPAVHLDIDHTVPWPLGPTHPSNLKVLCRIHHLVKTFESGWSDIQHPDGTVVWTSPTGRTYTTKPGGTLFFPQFGFPTGALEIPDNIDPPNPGRLMAMPTRRRSRAADRAGRITWERSCNEFRLAVEAAAREEAERLRAQEQSENDEPPPF